MRSVKWTAASSPDTGNLNTTSSPDNDRAPHLLNRRNMLCALAGAGVVGGLAAPKFYDAFLAPEKVDIYPHRDLNPARFPSLRNVALEDVLDLVEAGQLGRGAILFDVAARLDAIASPGQDLECMDGIREKFFATANFVAKSLSESAYGLQQELPDSDRFYIFERAFKERLAGLAAECGAALSTFSMFSCEDMQLVLYLSAAALVEKAGVPMPVTAACCADLYTAGKQYSPSRSNPQIEYFRRLSQDDGCTRIGTKEYMRILAPYLFALGARVLGEKCEISELCGCKGVEFDPSSFECQLLKVAGNCAKADRGGKEELCRALKSVHNISAGQGWHHRQELWLLRAAVLDQLCSHAVGYHEKLDSLSRTISTLEHAGSLPQAGKLKGASEYLQGWRLESNAIDLWLSKLYFERFQISQDRDDLLVSQQLFQRHNRETHSIPFLNPQRSFTFLRWYQPGAGWFSYPRPIDGSVDFELDRVA